ncbi:RAN GTPase-activating protein 2-like [Pyrus ussuriensis x Pyrus communis]|uniref:RAN GTPase-activating protein 2-like n=1 Tax=Pyrus ussuriensis x Pyrus communis TaxID=2448454 RepID=A0A5N5I112_9ROSA|nr:RAN GTPase-activating protein 2-like [Pyrus ussuriensis x Pyrus communis]
MVSSFSNPGFPPVHTHPPTFFAMVAANKDSLRKTLDALFAPFLVLRSVDSTSTPMFAISDEGFSDPAPMISDDTESIDLSYLGLQGDDNPPRLPSLIEVHFVPPLFSSSPLLREIAALSVKPQSNSNASKIAHSNNIKPFLSNQKAPTSVQVMQYEEATTTCEGVFGISGDRMSFIDAGKTEEQFLPSRDDEKSCTNICVSKRSFGMDAACVAAPILLFIKDLLQEIDLSDFTVGRSEEEAFERYLNLLDNAMGDNDVNAFGSLLSSQKKLEELYLMNMARLNKCHNMREWHCDVIRNIKWLNEKEISVMIITEGQANYEDFSDCVKDGDELMFELLLYFKVVKVEWLNRVTKITKSVEALNKGKKQKAGEGGYSDEMKSLHELSVNKAVDMATGKWDVVLGAGDLSLLVENTSVERLGVVIKVTIFKDSTTIVGDAASKDGLQVHGGSPIDIMGRNLLWEKQLQRRQIGACYAEASN